MDAANLKPVVYQFLKFALVGVLNTAINFLVLNLLSHLFGVTKGEAVIGISIVAFTVATANSYFLNKRWSFQDKTGGDSGRKLSLFLIVSLIGLAINSGTVYLITTYTRPMFGLSGTLWLNAAAVVATGISLIWNFIGYKIFVFKHS